MNPALLQTASVIRARGDRPVAPSLPTAIEEARRNLGQPDGDGGMPAADAAHLAHRQLTAVVGDPAWPAGLLGEHLPQ